MRLFWRSMMPVEQQHIVTAYTFEPDQRSVRGHPGWSEPLVVVVSPGLLTAGGAGADVEVFEAFGVLSSRACRPSSDCSSPTEPLLDPPER